jgi:hypothetical protein
MSHQNNIYISHFRAKKKKKYPNTQPNIKTSLFVDIWTLLTTLYFYFIQLFRGYEDPLHFQ